MICYQESKQSDKSPTPIPSPVKCCVILYPSQWQTKHCPFCSACLTASLRTASSAVSTSMSMCPDRFFTFSTFTPFICKRNYNLKCSTHYYPSSWGIISLGSPPLRRVKRPFFRLDLIQCWLERACKSRDHSDRWHSGVYQVGTYDVPARAECYHQQTSEAVREENYTTLCGPRAMRRTSLGLQKRHQFFFAIQQ